jgi:hypothetical protein
MVLRQSYHAALRAAVPWELTGWFEFVYGWKAIDVAARTDHLHLATQGLQPCIRCDGSEERYDKEQTSPKVLFGRSHATCESSLPHSLQSIGGMESKPHSQQSRKSSTLLYSS